MRNRKETSWKKSRKFGDVKGGRMRKKLDDNIFKRHHSIPKPSPFENLPILIQDNPSRDFFFPISAEEAVEALEKLPKEHVDGITHIWLRKMKKNDYEAGELPFAEFICGSGVRLVILYPWPKDKILRFGNKKPSKRKLRSYSKWSVDLYHENDIWCLRWTDEALHRFYVEHLLYHEVGHHVDWYQRHWSKANRRQIEDFANQYAVYWSSAGSEALSNL